MKLTDANFKRRFSINYYRNLTLKLGEMSFFKDWVNAAGRGDPYPTTYSSGSFTERTGDSKYTVSFSGESEVHRLLGAYFPWASCDVDIESMSSETGLYISSPIGDVSVTLLSDGKLLFVSPNSELFFDTKISAPTTLSFEFRNRGVSIYEISGAKQKFITDFKDEFLTELTRSDILADTKMNLLLRGSAGKSVISRVEWYIHAGISQADIRPIRYEDGTPIIERGRVFFTATARFFEYKYQVVLSWNPTLCDFKLEGAILFESGDGYLLDDVASSLIYDRNAGFWRIAMCSFSRGHIIGRGVSHSDPRFGINVIDINLVPPAEKDADRYDLFGFDGDEDPDMIYVDGRWYFAVCRPEEDGYHYYHFVSRDLESFEFVARTEGTEKTGGLYVRAEDGIYFVCGSDFKKRAVYDVYTLDNLSTPVMNLTPDYDDGGFRGWGSVMMLPCGSRYRYYWVTFDRHLGSSFNWSYGNVYVFESEMFKLGS